jgi:ribosome-associated toxin RatA of RatAB toxin-antitoxin module
VPARQLLGVVLDVDSYQDFLPFCRHSRVLQQFRTSNSFRATLTVGIPPVLLETYVSHVVVQEGFEDARRPGPRSGDEDSLKTYTVTTRSIQSQYLDSLWSRWKLQEVAAAPHRGAKSSGDDASQGPSPLHQSNGSSSTPYSGAAYGGYAGTKEAEQDSGSGGDGGGGGCHVEFEVEMSVRDPIIAAALDQMLPKVAVQQVDAFVARCRQQMHKQRQ